jgi:hypothetical protein
MLVVSRQVGMRVEYIGYRQLTLGRKVITNMSNRFDINWTFLKFNNFRGRPE